MAANANSGAMAMVISRARGVPSRTFAAMNRAMPKPRMRSVTGSAATLPSSTDQKERHHAGERGTQRGEQSQSPGSGGSSNRTTALEAIGAGRTSSGARALHERSLSRCHRDGDASPARNDSAPPIAGSG